MQQHAANLRSTLQKTNLKSLKVLHQIFLVQYCMPATLMVTKNNGSINNGSLCWWSCLGEGALWWATLEKKTLLEYLKERMNRIGSSAEGGTDCWYQMEPITGWNNTWRKVWGKLGRVLKCLEDKQSRTHKWKLWQITVKDLVNPCFRMWETVYQHFRGILHEYSREETVAITQICW